MKKVLSVFIFLSLTAPLFSQNIYSEIYKGSYDEVKKLLESGESPNSFNSEYENTKNRTKVFTRNKENKDLEKIIMERARDKPFKDGKTLYSIELDNVYAAGENTFEYPLFAAIISQNYEIADLLIESGAYLNIYQKFPIDTDVINRDNYYFQAAGLKYYFNSAGCYYATRDAVSVYHSPLSLLYSYLYADRKNSSVIQKLIIKAIKKGANPQYPNRVRLESDMYLNERFIPFNMLALAILEKDIKNVKLLVENKHYINSYPLQSVEFQKKKYQIFPASSLTEFAEKYSTPEIAKYLTDMGGIKLPADYNPKKAFYKDNNGKYLPTSKKDILCIEREYSHSKFIQKYAYYFTEYGRNPYKPGTISHLITIKDYKSTMFLLKKVKMVTPYDMLFIINSGKQDLIDEAMNYFDAPHAITYFKTEDQLALYEENRNRNYTSAYIESMINKNKELAARLLEKDENSGLDKNYSLSCLTYSTLLNDTDIVSSFIKKTDMINNAFGIYGRSGPKMSEEEKKKIYNTNSEYKVVDDVISPFLFALKYSSPEIISIFINKGADLNKEFELFNASASINGEYDIKKKKYKPYSKDKQKNMIKTKQYEKFTPLLYYTAVVTNDDIAVVKLLVENGADVNYKSPLLNETAVYHAGNYETIKYFCDKKADLNAFNLNYPRYPSILWKRATSHAAKQPDYEKILTVLIKSGADKKMKAYKEYPKPEFLTLSKYASEEKIDILKAALKQK